ncbi:hypothetical protein LSAT2_010279 [Lamellibrachia satsuma]|nr:hypothetical protein LSAT2_010279 [Lamellibrachia satsuma]
MDREETDTEKDGVNSGEGEKKDGVNSGEGEKKAEDLNGCKLSSEGTEALANALHHLPQLTTLRLDGNRFDNPHSWPNPS